MHRPARNLNEEYERRKKHEIIKTNQILGSILRQSDWNGLVMYGELGSLVCNTPCKRTQTKSGQEDRWIKDAKEMDDKITMEMTRNRDRWNDLVEACTRS